MKHILLVDDEPELLQMLSSHFADRYTVDTATSSAAAVARFIQRRPDVVFLDVNMKGTSGVHVLKLFQEADSRVPVIMVTANSEIRIADECLKSGAFGWVPKPPRLVYMDHMAAMAMDQRRK